MTVPNVHAVVRCNKFHSITEWASNTLHSRLKLYNLLFDISVFTKRARDFVAIDEDERLVRIDLKNFVSGEPETLASAADKLFAEDPTLHSLLADGMNLVLDNQYFKADPERSKLWPTRRCR